MNLNTLIIQLVCLFCALLLLRARSTQKGWVMVAGVILGAIAATHLLAPAYTAWVSGSLWLTFYLVPILGFAWVGRLVRQERYGLAHQVAACFRWLHPLDGWMQYPEILRGLELGQQGQMEEAIQRLRRYQMGTDSLGRLATALLYRMGAQWEEVVAWVHSHSLAEAAFNEVSVGTIYLRSLGETGDLDGLLQGIERFEQILEQIGDRFTPSIIKLYGLAFCGQVEQVRDLLSRALTVLPISVQRYWLATAEMAAGNEAFARQQLLALQGQADPALKRAIAWRLSQPPVKLETTLTDTSRKILIRLRMETGHESRYSYQQVVRGRTAYLTYGLIAANLAMFWLELQQSSTPDFYPLKQLGASISQDALEQLGALIPQSVVAGEWWRTISANFLHVNLTHLLINMIGLLFLGRFVEAVLGTFRFLIAYAVCGIGSMGTVTSLNLLLKAPAIICVGASGAIMGLLGIMIAVYLRGWRRDRARLAGRELRLLLLLAVFQTIFDLLNPEISLTGHVSGLILGFISGSLLIAIPKFASKV